MCASCEEYSPTASKKCKSCFEVFPKKAGNRKKIELKGTTNPTSQREMLEYRLSTSLHFLVYKNLKIVFDFRHC